MTLREVGPFHRSMFVPSRMTVIASGDASHEALADLVERAFGGWTAAGDAASPADPPATRRPASPQDRVALLHRPAAAQSELRIGHVAVARDTPDYHALLVLNMVLGGQFVSRINMNLREDKGYTYGARTSFDFRRGPGPFALHASVQSEVTVDAILEALSELRAIRGDRPVTRKELETGRAGLTRGYPRNFETAEQISRGAAQLALYGLPDDYFSTFVPRVLAVDEADVTRVAAEHIDPSRFLIVIVGDRDKVGPGASAAESRHAAGSRARLTSRLRPVASGFGRDETPPGSARNRASRLPRPSDGLMRGRCRLGPLGWLPVASGQFPVSDTVPDWKLGTGHCEL